MYSNIDYHMRGKQSKYDERGALFLGLGSIN